VSDLKDDRTLRCLALLIEFSLAIGEVMGQLAPKAPHGFDSLVNLLQFSAQQFAHAPTLVRASAIRKQFPDLIKREAYLLRLLDKTNALDSLWREDAKSANRARGARQEAQPLVITNRVDADAAAHRQFADAKFSHSQVRLLSTF